MTAAVLEKTPPTPLGQDEDARRDEFERRIAFAPISGKIRRAILESAEFGWVEWAEAPDRTYIVRVVAQALLRAGFTSEEVAAVCRLFPLGRGMEDSPDEIVSSVLEKTAEAQAGSRFPKGVNFEVMRAVRLQAINSCAVSFRLFDRREVTVRLRLSDLASPRALKAACLSQAGFVPELPEGYRGQGYLVFVQRLLAACETKIGNDPDQVVISSVADLVARKEVWKGTASDLLRDLSKSMGQVPLGWPETPRSLAASLRRHHLSLLSKGVDMAFKRGAGKERERLIYLRSCSKDYPD